MINYIQDFMNAADAATDKFDPRMVALYTGLQLEELTEKLAAIEAAPGVFPKDSLSRLRHVVHVMTLLGDEFKKGTYDDPVKNADQVQMLDADVDVAWVSIGGSKSMGADFDGAAAEVYRSNMSKTDPDTGKMGRDQNGKITKHPRYSPPNLVPFIAANRAK